VKTQRVENVLEEGEGCTERSRKQSSLKRWREGIPEGRQRLSSLGHSGPNSWNKENLAVFSNLLL